eukprot:2896197-Amphidinium_carterae.1
MEVFLEEGAEHFSSRVLSVWRFVRNACCEKDGFESVDTLHFDQLQSALEHNLSPELFRSVSHETYKDCPPSQAAHGAYIVECCRTSLVLPYDFVSSVDDI